MESQAVEAPAIAARLAFMARVRAVAGELGRRIWQRA